MAQQEKKGRNQIVYELAKQNIKASAGSVSNILRKCNEGNDKNNLSGQDVVAPEATISTTIDPPSSNLGDGLVYDQDVDRVKSEVSVLNNMSQKVINAPSEPLITSDKEEPTNLKDVDFDNISYPDFYPAVVLAEVLEAEKREIESSHKELDADKKAFEEETEAIRTRMRQKISSEKYLLKHESLIIEQKQKGLDERMKKVEQKERDLVIRETIVSESELFLPIVRRLQNMGLEFEAIIPWIETVTEVAQGTDPRIAAQYIAYELSAFSKLGGLQKATRVNSDSIRDVENGNCAERKRFEYD